MRTNNEGYFSALQLVFQTKKLTNSKQLHLLTNNISLIFFKDFMEIDFYYLLMPGKYRHHKNHQNSKENEKENKNHENRHHHENQKVETTEENESDNNCTVAFMSQCMSLNRCKVSCKSMGSARYRWFHEFGCCQCIGSTCLGYGKNEPLCLRCPEVPDEIDQSEKDTVIGFEQQIDNAKMDASKAAEGISSNGPK